MGAWAGGDALARLLAGLPTGAGLALVVVPPPGPGPADPRAADARRTRLTVVEAKSGMRPEADHVYLTPPGVNVVLERGLLRVVPAAAGAGAAHPIDQFFSSLAAEQGSRAVGLVLSDTASEGADGLRAIRAEGGIALAEDQCSPQRAVTSASAVPDGAADRWLSIPDLARELVDLARTAYLRDPQAAVAAPLAADRDDEGELIRQVLERLREVSGYDFSQYKATTFRRRLARRMLLEHCPTLAGYVERLQRDAREVDALGRDILVHVTGFFRDPDVFAVLASDVMPEMAARAKEGGSIRIWVPGCSTGEEAYSLAIAMDEVLGGGAGEVPFQIFGTDISAEMIEQARAGVYAPSQVEELDAARRERYFVGCDGGYRIAPSIRGRCVFARHDLTRDVPFAHLDLISCRNVLGYFESDLQRRLLSLLHYCLQPGGVLLLGRSEGMSAGNLFAPVDAARRIYRKVGASRPLAGLLTAKQRAASPTAALTDAAAVTGDVQRQADLLLLARHASPAALVDDAMEIIHLRGQTAPFLDVVPGRPTLNLLRIAHASLRAPLRTAVERARRDRVVVRRRGLTIRGGEQPLRVDLEVTPLAGGPADGTHFLVVFDPASERARAHAGRRPTDREAARELRRMREESDATRAYLHALLDERERMNQEMSTNNEELLAANQELKSINEELARAKEELHLANEELRTTNDELADRNQELARTNSDLDNLIASVDLPIVLVGGDLQVRRFTPGARLLLNLIPGDVGRPVDDIKLNVVIDDLAGSIREVIESQRAKELEVADRRGRWFRLQIRPYREDGDRVDGAVIALFDIDLLKSAVVDATAALDQVSAILRAIPVPLVVLDDHFSVCSANPAYYETYRADPASTVGRVWFETCDGTWDLPELRAALARLLEVGGDAGLETTIRPPGGDERTIAVAASLLRSDAHGPVLIITPSDITERAELLHQAQEARAQIERASQAKDVFLATLSHELRAPLHTIVLHADLLLAGAAVDPLRSRAAAQAIERAATAQERLIADLLDVSAIIAGKISLKRRPVALQAALAGALDSVRDAAERKRITIRTSIDPGVGQVIGDEARLQQVVGNLLSNAVKFTPPGGEIVAELTATDRHARIRVSDTGQGIAPELLPRVFDRFVQGDPSAARVHGGLGLGLAIVRDLVELHGGTVSVASDGLGRGATFTVELPLAARSRRALSPAEAETDSGTHPVLAAPVPALDLTGMRLLVVDDDVGSSVALAEILRLHGADVRTAERAADAMAALAEFRPDILLCDLAMPGEDGLSLITRVRALPADEGGATPAIAVTAMASRIDRRRALAAGFQLHLAKPATAEALTEAVRRVRGDRRTVQ